MTGSALKEDVKRPKRACAKCEATGQIDLWWFTCAGRLERVCEVCVGKTIAAGRSAHTTGCACFL